MTWPPRITNINGSRRKPALFTHSPSIPPLLATEEGLATLDHQHPQQNLCDQKEREGAFHPQPAVPVGVLRIRLEAHNHAVGDDDKGHHGLQKPGSRSSRTWLLKYVEISQTQVTLDLK